MIFFMPHLRKNKLFTLFFLISTMNSIASMASSKYDTAWGEIRADTPSSTPGLPLSQESQSTEGVGEVEEIDIAIVGGGLTGLSLAIGLTRAGISCKVYERAPKLRSVSQGMIAIKTIGMQALETIHPDIPARVAQVGYDVQSSVMSKVDEDGNTEDAVYVRDQGRKLVGVTWHNMQQALASLLPSGVVRTGHSLLSFTEEDDSESVLLHFEGGRVVRCQAALMCDGVFSVGRRQMFPEDRAIYFGQLNWGSIVRTDSLPPGMHPPNVVRSLIYSGDPKWSAMLNDGGGGYTFFQLRISDSSKAQALSGNNGRGGLGLPGALEKLLPIVKPCKDVTLALENIPEEQLFERCIVGRRAAPTWLSAGKRVALVGDSAHGMHPNIGHGANTGFESAHLLIEALKDCNGDWTSGLEFYEKTHKPRADLIQSFANLMGCVQSQQRALFLSKEAEEQMLDWVNVKDGMELPPEEELEIIRLFDPLSQENVSLI